MTGVLSVHGSSLAKGQLAAPLGGSGVPRTANSSSSRRMRTTGAARALKSSAVKACAPLGGAVSELRDALRLQEIQDLVQGVEGACPSEVDARTSAEVPPRPLPKPRTRRCRG